MKKSLDSAQGGSLHDNNALLINPNIFGQTSPLRIKFRICYRTEFPLTHEKNVVLRVVKHVATEDLVYFLPFPPGMVLMPL